MRAPKKYYYTQCVGSVTSVLKICNKLTRSASFQFRRSAVTLLFLCVQNWLIQKMQLKNAIPGQIVTHPMHAIQSTVESQNFPSDPPIQYGKVNHIINSQNILVTKHPAKQNKVALSATWDMLSLFHRKYQENI